MQSQRIFLFFLKHFYIEVCVNLKREVVFYLQSVYLLLQPLPETILGNLLDTRAQIIAYLRISLKT